jgi:hypothetical protein
VFCIYLRTNSDLCQLQHKLIGFYNPDESVYSAVRTVFLNKAVCAEETGTAVAQWLRHCARNQKVVFSIPDGVMEFFIDINPSDRTMVLGPTQPLTEMSTRIISWV